MTPAHATSLGRISIPRPSILLTRFLVPSIAIVLFSGGNLSAQDTKRYANEWRHDFRGKPAPPELKIVGNKDNLYVKHEPEGLRVTIPKPYIHEFGGIGVRTEFGFRGDFEIIGALEILQAETPPGGYGVGASIRIGKADSPEGATLARVVRGGGRQVCVWDRAHATADGKTKTTEGVKLCAAKVLRLRMTRVGTKLHYAWAPGLEGGEFQEIHVEDFGDDDIKAARLCAFTGRMPCDVDVRLLEFSVRSGGAAAANAPVAAPGILPAVPTVPEVDASKGSLAIVLGIGGAIMVLLLVATGVGFFVIQRRRAAAVAGAETNGKPVKNSSPEMFTVTCAGCGKALKVKTSLAGKRVKCTQCGKAVPVPADKSSDAEDE